MKNSEKQILVIGGTGKTGRRVAQLLIQNGYNVRIGSRSAEIKFDWENKSTWKQALQDMHAVYISFHPDLAVPGSVEAIRSLSGMAVAAGIKQLVLLSGRGEVEAQECEQIIMQAGLDYTIVRASWFCQNFSEGAFLDPILAGHVALPAGDTPEPFIDVDDIAAIAVAALTEKGHSGKIYEVTGPRLLTFKEAIEEISKATGKQIYYEQVSIKDYTETLVAYKVPNETISFITYLFAEVLDGRNANLTDGVQQALGRKPTDFAAYVKKSVAAGLWS